jgi:hypothetical protein
MLSRVQYVLRLSLLSSCINFISRSSKKSVRLANQGVEGQSESTILLSMGFLLDLAFIYIFFLGVAVQGQ